mgnify:CR=1 FL=1
MSQHRQKILLAVLGLLLVYFGGEWAWQNAIQGPLDARRARIRRLEKDLDKRQRELAQARKAMQELETLHEQSLPSDPQVARSLYRAWLLQLVTRVGFANRNVEAGEPANRRGLFQSILFTIQGRGTLEQLTRFLYDFYRAGHLHQIQSLSITPLSNSGQLDLSLVVEALVLPLEEEKDQLSQSPSDRLAWERFEDYAVIPQRNLFGAVGASDPVDHTFITAIQHVDGKPEVWLTVQTEDRVLKLKPGESFQIGPFAGKVVEIDGDDVVLEGVGGQRWLVSFGESLAQSLALPPEY